MGKEISRIAFVFSGGLSRGAIQSAFVKQVLDKITLDKVCCISGSSIGSLNAYAAGCGNIDNAIKFYSNLDCDNTSSFMKKVSRGLFDKAYGVIEGEMQVPIYTTATRIIELECYYYCLNNMPRSDIKKAINVAMSYPIINGPLRFNHRLWIDGGATDNVPILPTTYYDPEMIIIFHNYPKFYPPEELYDLIKPETIVIDVDVTLSLPKEFTSFSLSKDAFLKMIEVGTESGKEFAEFIFQDMDIDNIRERCFQYTRDHIDARHEKSGDALMTFVDVLNSLYRLKTNL